MRRRLFLCLSALLVGSIAFAEDFWTKKEYMQWTDQEVKKLITDSPWAKDITVSAPLAALGRGQRAAVDSDSNGDSDTAGGGGGRRGGGRRGGGGGFGGGGGNSSSEALLTLNISWRSALPLRKALVRSRVGATGAAIPPEAAQLISRDEEDYFVVVSGMPAAMARTIQAPVQVEQSTIRAGKKPPVAAKTMDVQRRTQTVDVIYTFPKTQPIASDDKEVEVDLRLGQIEAKKKFSLKDMVYNGKLEL
jgi:hypothetical protein